MFVARTCNEVVPAQKEFLRARQTPVPLICIGCWVLACTVPGTRYAAPGTRSSRLEYVQRVLVSYNTTAAVRIMWSRTSPFPFSISKASPAGFRLHLAQTHQNLVGRQFTFFSGRQVNF